MLSQGFRLFSRNYHAGVLTKNIDVMFQFMKRSEFMEAKNKHHIDFNNMHDVNSQVLEETLSVLFSETNAPKALKALDRGDLILKKLLMADSVVRQQYLKDFSSQSTTVNWHEFELKHAAKGLETRFSCK